METTVYTRADQIVYLKKPGSTYIEFTLHITPEQSKSIFSEYQRMFCLSDISSEPSHTVVVDGNETEVRKVVFRFTPDTGVGLLLQADQSKPQPTKKVNHTGIFLHILALIALSTESKFFVGCYVTAITLHFLLRLFPQKGHSRASKN